MTIQQAGDQDVLYTINDKRYRENLLQMQQPGSSDQKLTLLNTYITAFGFNCSQVWGLVNTLFNDDTKIQGLQILRNNIIDPQNKQTQIINQFTSDSTKQRATTLLANITACQTVGVAPDVFPYPVINYTSAWNDSDFNALMTQINKASFSTDKLAIAETAIMNTSLGITANQTVLLFGAFGFSNDMVVLANVIHEKIMGVFCNEMQKILNKFSFASDKLSALTAFKYTIIDVENKYNILDSFYMSDDKEKARLILDDLRPKSFIFDVPTGNCVFVLDYSGSMDTTFTLSTGEKLSRLQFVQKEFEKTALGFDNKTTFDIVIFNESPKIWRTSLANSTYQNIQDGIALTKKYRAGGGTDIFSALSVAWAVPKVETIYLLTDGVPTSGITNIDSIMSKVSILYKNVPVKVNTIAFLMGSDSSDNKPLSKYFMKRLADATNGTYRALESDK